MTGTAKPNAYARWIAAARIVLAVLGGYLLANWSMACVALVLTRGFGMHRGDAVILATLLGILIYVAAIVLAIGMPQVARTFRASIAWLHTWTGVTLGALLFAIFWMGSLSVFDREIDRWMMPMTRLAPPAAQFSADLAWRLTENEARGSPLWVLQFPTAREPAARVLFASARNPARVAPVGTSRKAIPLPKERLNRVNIDPHTGTVLPAAGTYGGTGFIFPFHWHLLVGEGSIGQWIVAAAGIAMLVLLVSGVVIHRRFFRELFTLRLGRTGGVTLLDLHKVTGAIGLPFYFLIAFSGLAIFFFMYFPAALNVTHAGGQRQFFNETRQGFARAAAGVPASMVPLDALVSRAQALWGGGAPMQLAVSHPGDLRGYVEVTRTVDDVVIYDKHSVFFDAHTGELLKHDALRPIARGQRFIAGAHFIFFHHWIVRWLYFVLGLTACLLICVGLLLWLQARTRRHGRSRAVRLVESLSVGATAGIIFATTAFLLANRLLPETLDDRAMWEVRTFFIAWALSFAHAWWRAPFAWVEQCRAIAVGATAAVVLNALTTGDNLLRTIGRGDWAVAGADLVLLAGAAGAMVCAHIIARKMRGRAASLRPQSEPLRNA